MGDTKPCGFPGSGGAGGGGGVCFLNPTDVAPLDHIIEA